MTALTEERFIELLGKFQKDINNRFESLEISVKDLQTAVRELKGFQDHESKAIEIDLQILLKKYLSSKYFTSRIIPFPLIKLYCPFTGKEITELDAAFLIEPFYKSYNKSATRKKNLNMYSKNNIFVLAEAKHHITRNKIKIKLQQFDEIRKLFKEAENVLINYMHKNISNYITSPDSTIHEAKRIFFETVRRYKFLGSIKETILFFGAAHWDKKLLNDIQADIRTYKKYAYDFNNFILEKKEIRNNSQLIDDINAKIISTYKLAYEIEKLWYDNPRLLNNEEIMKLSQLPSSLQFCELIIPSGDRYTIVPSSSSENYVPLTAQLDYKSVYPINNTIFL